jgi:hypothetical protein
MLNYSRESSANAGTKAKYTSSSNSNSPIVDIHNPRCLAVSSTQFYSRYSKSPVLCRIFWLHPPPARTSTGKRHAPHEVVDLTMDHRDLESDSQAQSIRYDTGAKKRDTKETPRQNLAGNISIKLERNDSPAPSELSMSMVEPLPPRKLPKVYVGMVSTLRPKCILHRPLHGCPGQALERLP